MSLMRHPLYNAVITRAHLSRMEGSRRHVAGSFKSQLIDYSDLPGGYGERLRGAFGSFMIIRPSLFKCDWSLFSIWNGVIVINQSG